MAKYSMFGKSDMVAAELKNINWNVLANNIATDNVNWEELIEILPNDLSPESQRILRNMPFAVVGYEFKNNDLLLFYSQFSWYKANGKITPDINSLNYDGMKFHLLAKSNTLNKPTSKNSVKMKLLVQHTPRSFYNSTAFFVDFFVHDSIAYILDKKGNIQVVDVADPKRPKRIDSLALGAENISTAGNYLYVINKEGMSIFDINGRGKPQRVGFLEGRYPSINSIYVSNGLAYLCGDQLDIIDVSNNISPKLLSTYQMESPPPETGACRFDGFHPQSIMVNDKLGHIMAKGSISCEDDMGAENSYELIDLSNPAEPQYRGSLPHILYGPIVASSESWVLIGGNTIDISKPASPRLIGERSRDNIYGINRTLATKIDKTNRKNEKLLLLEIINPLASRTIGESKLPGNDVYIWRQQISGEYLYVLTDNNMFQIYSIR